MLDRRHENAVDLREQICDIILKQYRFPRLFFIGPGTGGKFFPGKLLHAQEYRQMKLSTRSRYGTRLVLDMAERYKEGPIQLGTIAKRQDISVKYLEQLIIPLKKARYVQSVRGSRGGHMLARSPDEITVGEIVELLEGSIKLADCIDNPKVCNRSGGCLTRIVWKEAAQAFYNKLNSITLADLLKMTRGERESMGGPDA
jgi:Rrf2 family iron-sulfur cluster assembly transcriptional regulator